MKVFTSQYRYSGPNRLDITVKGNPNHILAPTWVMVRRYMAKEITDAEYTKEYYALLKSRWSGRKQEFYDITKNDVVLVCYCKAGAFCHRTLAKDILVNLGMEDGGEI